MGRHPHEVSRAELIARLGRREVSEARLLRWHHWGFLPQPRRDGHGRGRGGSTSYYPEIVVLQAHVIARMLKAKRHKVEAGWGLWALGFREPPSAWVRLLLCAELKQQEAVLRDRPGQQRELARIADARKRPVRGTATMRTVLQPAAVAAVMQLLVEIELGTIRPEAAEGLDDEWVRDAIIAELRPPPEDERSYPSGQKMTAEVARIAREAPLSATRKLIEALLDPVLRAFANEAQVLFEFMHRPSTLEESVMPRSFFIGYLRSQILSPAGQAITLKLRKAMGWTQPPRSPLGRAIAELGHQAVPHASGPSPLRTP